MPSPYGNRLLAISAVVLASGAAAWWWTQRTQPVATEPEPPPAVVEAPAEEAPPPIANPLPEPAADALAALPPLAESDVPVATQLAALFGEDAVRQWLVPDAVVRRFVAAIDNLPRPNVSERFRPLKGPTEPPVVTRRPSKEPGSEDTIQLAEANYRRYDAYIEVLRATDAAMIAATYQRLYPLFQQTYEDLGYPGQYFNDRLVGVIDHLIETPSLTRPVLLVQPNVMYEFADPALESLSAGQKLLLRMGPRHAAVVKAKLRELRTAITAAPAAGRRGQSLPSRGNERSATNPAPAGRATGTNDAP